MFTRLIIQLIEAALILFEEESDWAQSFKLPFTYYFPVLQYSTSNHVYSNISDFIIIKSFFEAFLHKHQP